MREDVALLDHLALSEGDFGDRAIDAAADENRLVRLHGAKSVQIDREVGLFHLRDSDRDERRRPRANGCVQTTRPDVGAVKVAPPEGAAHRDSQEGSRERPAAATRRRARRGQNALPRGANRQRLTLANRSAAHRLRVEPPCRLWRTEGGARKGRKLPSRGEVRRFVGPHQ